MTSITETIATLNEITSVINKGQEHTKAEYEIILTAFNLAMDQFNENASIIAARKLSALMETTIKPLLFVIPIFLAKALTLSKKKCNSRSKRHGY